MIAVQQIDRALKRLYNLGSNYCAEEFLIKYCPTNLMKKVASKDLNGALYIQPVDSAPDSTEPTVDIGIYLSDEIRNNLDSFVVWSSPWTQSQLQAFSIACEEVSHFHYLVYNLERNRPVSQFELELQGEVDKFFLLFFSEFISSQSRDEKFDILYNQLFFNFRLIPTLTPEQVQRYMDATLYARKFINKIRKDLSKTNSINRVFGIARTYYQKDLAGKVGI